MIQEFKTTGGQAIELGVETPPAILQALRIVAEAGFQVALFYVMDGSSDTHSAYACPHHPEGIDDPASIRLLSLAAVEHFRNNEAIQ
jgi:hypothetical protein